MKGKEMPEGAELSDIFIYPLTRKGELSGKDIIQSFGYVGSSPHCAKCAGQINPRGFRPSGWTYNCDVCGNFIVFTDIGKYVDVIGRWGKDLDSMRDYLLLHFGYKGKEGFNEGKDRIIRSPSDLKEEE